MASRRSLYAMTMVLGISQAARTFLTGLEQQQPWRLENFTKELFWEQPPDGNLYYVDIVGRPL